MTVPGVMNVAGGSPDHGWNSVPGWCDQPGCGDPNGPGPPNTGGEIVTGCAAHTLASSQVSSAAAQATTGIERIVITPAAR